MVYPSEERIVHHIKRGVCERNHALIPFSLVKKDFDIAVGHFFDFLSLPDEVKNKFQSNVVLSDEESFVGYVKREKQRRVDVATKEAFYDQKEYFHYNRYAEKNFGHLVADDLRIRAFFDSARNIYEHAEALAKRIIHDLDVDFPELSEKFLPDGVDPHFYLRFLRYFTSGTGEFLAKGHYDQGGYTLALAESAPGLRIGKGEKDLKEVVHVDGHVIFMPGLQLQFFTSSDFTPAWHDVVQKSDDTFDAKTARWAVVFFVDPVEKIRTRWEDRHTPAH